VLQRGCVMQSCDFRKRGISNGNSEVCKKAATLISAKNKQFYIHGVASSSFFFSLYFLFSNIFHFLKFVICVSFPQFSFFSFCSIPQTN